jgi:hypothetical protein
MMKKLGKWLAVSIVGYCFLTACTSITEANDTLHMLTPIHGIPSAAKVTTKLIKEESSLYKVNISIPVIEGMKDASYQKELNDRIASMAMKDLDTVKQRAVMDDAELKKAGLESHGFPYEIVVQYEVTSPGSEREYNRFSIKLTTYTFTGGAHGITRTDTYNALNEIKAMPVSLEDLFGSHYKEIINASIKMQIANHPENYFQGVEGFKGISDHQMFYIQNGRIAVIVFAPYDIAPYVTGTPQFPVPIPADKHSARRIP